jgi:predicted amidohydrolase
MRAALVQLQPADDLRRNVRLADARLREAAANGAQVICFPEIQLSPFFPQFPGRDASRWEVGVEHEAITVLRRACRELGVAAFPNIYLREGAHAFDATIGIGGDGGILGISKMVHVPRVPRFYEQDYYTPSDSGFRVYDTGSGRIGVVICFDRHFPESIRTCVLRGAQLIVVPTANTRDEDLELFAWELRVAAAQNSVFAAMCNRVGREDAMTFGGESIVVGPAGEVIAMAGDVEQILYADIDLGRIDRERERRPYLGLRRPEVYEA